MRRSDSLFSRAGQPGSKKEASGVETLSLTDFLRHLLWPSALPALPTSLVPGTPSTSCRSYSRMLTVPREGSLYFSQDQAANPSQFPGEQLSIGWLRTKRRTLESQVLGQVASRASTQCPGWRFQTTGITGCISNMN